MIYKIYSKRYEILLTAGILSLPFLYIFSQRKFLLFKSKPPLIIKIVEFSTKEYFRSSMITRTMLEKHQYIHLELLKCANMTKSIDQVSYKKDVEVKETYIAAMPLSLRGKRSRNKGKGVVDYQNLWDKDRDIVRVELAGIKHPWQEDTIEYFNSTWLLKQRRYE